jgi:hypothetical protein
MANRHGGLEELLDFTSTPAWRSAILFAAVSFAAFHCVALATPPLLLDATGQATQLAPQLLHLAAVLLRFLAPLACFAVGTLAYFRRATRRLPKRIP